ncbi:MAG: ASKHA domain-containing protein [Peptococcaceae bacterium]
MIKVRFLPSEKTVEVPSGNSILQAAIAAGEQIESTCGGQGTCGKCKVKIVSPPQPAERVLACRYSLLEDTVVELPEAKEVNERKLGFSEVVKNVPVTVSIRKYLVNVPPATVTDQTSDWERLLSVLPFADIPFSRRVAANLPKTLRREHDQVTVVMEGNEILAVESGDTRERSFGLAVDVGTTTLVVHLLDLLKGTVVGSGADTNPQQVFGADVISRISHAAGNPDGLRQLQQRVRDGLNNIIAKLSKDARVQREEIYQGVVVGNTTMSHLFLGIDPAYLAPSPFVPAFRQLVEVEAGELGINILSTGRVTVLPNVAGYVGSDTVGVMLAAGVDRLKGINLIIDIGTNGEIILAGKNKIITCSTAAGPAFEGAEIKYGMRAAQGAIEGVRIVEDVELEIIAGGKPRGICGSGLIDAIAEMVRTGIIDPSGRLAGADNVSQKLPPLVRKRLRQTEQGREFILVRSEDSAIGEDIVLTQKDIRELQLAKGAILAGSRILLREMEVEVEEIDQVLLAGAFGNYIKKESAQRIGLLPPIPLEHIISIGNAACEGAKLALLAGEERARAVSLAKQAVHIELSGKEGFQQEFIRSLSLGAGN